MQHPMLWVEGKCDVGFGGAIDSPAAFTPVG